MSQELSRIERPSAAQYQGKRKLLLAPLIFGVPAEATEGVEILQRYWEQMQSQISSLERSLGPLRRIYHESLVLGSQEGLQQLGLADQRSHGFVAARVESGAAYWKPPKTPNRSLESLDLQRCMMLPLASPSVVTRLQEWFAEATRKRYAGIGQQIDTTLQPDELGLLMISERHQVQFPPDIEVFYIAPPALDDFHRWVQRWASEQQRAHEEAMREAAESADAEQSGF